MDRKAFSMAVFMGLYVPLFTGISVVINRLTPQTTEESKKIIIVRRQFEKQSFEIAKNSIFQLDKSQNFISTDESDLSLLSFYKLLPPAYTRDSNLLQNFDLDKIAISRRLDASRNAESKSQINPQPER